MATTVIEETTSDQKLFSLEASSKTLGGISISTLKRDIRLGKIQAVRYGRRVLIPGHEISRIARAGMAT
ncbi:MAG: hypothetical protein JO340_16205 [Acidobacteriaceae bacterium]|nr:hypothetical protein [Acidobacteriaceae bacterium]